MVLQSWHVFVLEKAWLLAQVLRKKTPGSVWLWTSHQSLSLILFLNRFLSPVTRDIAYPSFCRNEYCFFLNQTKELLSFLMMHNRKASASILEYLWSVFQHSEGFAETERTVKTLDSFPPSMCLTRKGNFHYFVSWVGLVQRPHMQMLTGIYF